MAARTPRNATFKGKKRVTKTFIERERAAGRPITGLSNAAGKPLRGAALAKRIERIEAQGQTPRRPGEEREVIEAGDPTPRLVTPWSEAQALRIERWQFAVTQARTSGDYSRILGDVFGARSGARYRVFIAGPTGRQPIYLETDPTALRAIDDAGMLGGNIERKRYPRSRVAEAA